MTTPHPERPPFWRHRYAYISLKLAVLFVGLLLALKFFSVV